MSWQAFRSRCQTTISSLRARIPARRLGQILVLSLAVGGLGIAGEAAFRAELTSPEARMPSAVYSRALPRGGDGSRAQPVLVATIDDRLAERRIPLRVEELSEHLIQAVLAVEDQRFYEHAGLDFRRIGEALLANLKARRVTQGGSTLTQELAKNLFLSADRTPMRSTWARTAARFYFGKDAPSAQRSPLGDLGPRRCRDPRHRTGARCRRPVRGDCWEDRHLE